MAAALPPAIVPPPASYTLAAATLAEYVHAQPSEQYVADSAAEAEAMIENHLNPGNVRRQPPQHVIHRALLEVGAELYYRRTSRNGVVGLDGGPDGFAPLRIARDPMKAAYDILRPYMLPALA